MSEFFIRIPAQEAQSKLLHLLEKAAMPADSAQLCARLLVEASRDGVPSHGLDRFPAFMASLRDGTVNANARPTRLATAGALEQWDGQLGPGMVNAWFSMDRAIQLAKEHGVGCVALRRTNHWMRAGSYGWQAAEAGMIGMCWTNTIALMPPWGSARPKLGNNPLVLAVPRRNGHLVLDMAMAQFSMGRLATMLRAGRQTSVPAGYDRQGQLTTDPATVIGSGRHLPIGYWKGAGLALMLDVIAAALSGGQATYQIAADKVERSVSQVFLVFDPASLGGADAVSALADAVVADLHQAQPLNPDSPVLYPGQRSLQARRDSLANGIPVHRDVWEQILRMDSTQK
jgi:3-dehydro-L-gulonate 2-dehydrogenase